MPNPPPKQSLFREWGNRINLLGIIVGVVCLLIPRSWATVVGVVIIMLCGSLIIWHLPWVEAFNGRRIFLITVLGIGCVVLGRATPPEDPKASPTPPAPMPYILTRLVIDSVDKDDVVFHLQIDNGQFPIKGIRAAYHTNNFNVDPEINGNPARVPCGFWRLPERVCCLALGQSFIDTVRVTLINS